MCTGGVLRVKYGFLECVVCRDILRVYSGIFGVCRCTLVGIGQYIRIPLSVCRT